MTDSFDSTYRSCHSTCFPPCLRVSDLLETVWGGRVTHMLWYRTTDGGNYRFIVPPRTLKKGGSGYRPADILVIPIDVVREINDNRETAQSIVHYLALGR